MRRLRVALGLCLLLVALPAFALPGEDEAVVRHCGKPASERRDLSPVTNQIQRDLFYGDIVLHFQAVEGGWSFTTAWVKHLPMTRTALEQRLPCFRDAMQEVASAPRPALDPTIEAQTYVKPIDGTTFGIPHFWLIIILGVILVLAVAVPSARRKKRVLPEPRVYHRVPEVVLESKRHRIAETHRDEE